MNALQPPWGHAPDADAIEAIPRAAMARLPNAFRVHPDGVVPQVEQFADEVTLEDGAA